MDGDVLSTKREEIIRLEILGRMLSLGGWGGATALSQGIRASGGLVKQWREEREQPNNVAQLSI